MIGCRAITLAGLAVLTVVVLLFGSVPASLAGISSSAHDFTGFGFVGEGACSACHKPHYSVDPQRLWPRDLTDERREFDQGDSAIETPNYIRGGTILCYDCHDNQNIADVDEDPDPIFWGNSIHGGPDGYPQDIAYDDHPGIQGTGEVGYYELADGSRPSGVSGGGPTDGSPTGGHYWKSAPANGGTPEYEQGDKLDCNICHDPHSSVTGTNDVMLRTSTSDGMGGTVDLGDGRTASTNTRARAGQDPQINNGRNMCASCHRYSDEPNAPGATANGIPTTTVDMWNVPLPQPPNSLPDHAYNASSTAACTDCHRHNKIVASCADCHGYPPIVASPFDPATNPEGESYSGGAGAHLAHFKGVGNLVSDPDLYNFGCLGGTCHPSGSHMEGGQTVVRGNVQITFDAAWNPNGVYNSGGTASSSTCSQLYCHSNGLVENGEYGGDSGTLEGGSSGLGEYAENSGNAAFYGTTPAVQPQWGQTFSGIGVNPCRGCHGKGSPDYQLEINSVPQAAEAVSPPDYYNAATQPVQDGNTIYNTTGANTHFIHVYKINSQDLTYGMWGGAGCGCHPVRDQRDPATGFSFHLNRRASLGDQGAVNDTGGAFVQGRGCANECHNGATPEDWGDNLAAAGSANDSCVFVCHGLGNPASGNYYGGSPGGRITKLATSAGSLDADDKYMQSGHGLGAGAYASGLPAANLACGGCHLLDDRGAAPVTRSYHYERVATATGNAAAPLAPGQPAANPYWLVAPYAANPDGLCESCHDGVTAVEGRNHTAQGMITYASYNPKYDGADTGQWSLGGTFDPNCVHCHDPHGESNWFMLYDGDAEKSAHDNTLILSGPVIYSGDRFGVTVAGADTHGFPPAPYAANQTAVTMLNNINGSDFATGTGSGICEVCHTATNFYRSNGTSPGGGHPTTLCTDCHEHPKSFAPSACEGCHNGVVRFDPDGAGPQPPAPNVMGDGSNPVGVGGVLDDRGIALPPQQYDDGTWGYNVNGHGSMTWNLQSRTVVCTDCHLLEAHHANGTLNTLDWPGKAGTTRVANTSHLVPGFLPAGTAQARQIAFDNYCTNQCHVDAGEMRHTDSSLPGPTYDGIMLFGEHFTNVAPKAVRAGWTLWGDNVLTATDGSAGAVIDNEKFTPGVGPGGGDPTASYWFPWTISDHTTGAAAPPYYGTCASCHDPHGTPTGDQSRGENHMSRFNWKRPPSSDPNFNCNSQCHRN